MLYNPKWNKPDVFSLSNLIVWLSKQPADATYEYNKCSDCLLAQYFKAHGYHNPTLSCCGVKHGLFKLRYDDLPEGFDVIARSGPHTFGAALHRALKRI